MKDTVETNPLVLESFYISKNWQGAYIATIKVKGKSGEQSLTLQPRHIIRVMDAAMSALAEAAIEQANQMREEVTSALKEVIAKQEAKAIAAPAVDDAEVI
ncbi:hypothetical protein [Tabrizicola sp. BL-A-41-H6]|uniref:hypothetical protein n=1 Tax=Tabrizicola sp. BL-A-41-H6 TaxID=3421107 RepID=UPI003D666C4F